MADTDIPILEPRLVDIDELLSHPQNYRTHPQDQLDEIKASIRANGFYRNVVVAEDHTILAGHGVVEASKQLGMSQVQIVELPIAPDSAQALKVLAGDNYLSKMAEDDDRMLTDLLKQVAELDDIDGLAGTGFDEMNLAALAMVTRPAEEIEDLDAAAEWVGMPDFEPADPKVQLVISCDTEQDRDDLIRKLEVHISTKTRQTWSCVWPPSENADPGAVMLDG